MLKVITMPKNYYYSVMTSLWKNLRKYVGLPTYRTSSRSVNYQSILLLFAKEFISS